MICLKTIKYLFILLIFSLIGANPIPMKSTINFILNSNDINKNGNPDVLAFEGRAIVKNVEIFDIENKSIKSIWKYSLPNNFIGSFTDASIVSFDDNTPFAIDINYCNRNIIDVIAFDIEQSHGYNSEFRNFL